MRTAIVLGAGLIGALVGAAVLLTSGKDGD